MSYHSPLRSKETQSATSPFMRPGIKMIETQLSSAWATVYSEKIVTPNQAATIMHNLIGEADREHFAALFLNSHYQVTHAHIVSCGSANSAPVHPREVFKAAVLANAAAIVVGHNHPSGDVYPSIEDHKVVERLKRAGELLGIEVLDALIVGPSKRFYATSSDSCSSLTDQLNGTKPAPSVSHSNDLEKVCRGLLQDIGEVFERQGKTWWDETVTAGTHHQDQAKRLLGLTPYRHQQDTPKPF